MLAPPPPLITPARSCKISFFHFHLISETTTCNDNLRKTTTDDAFLVEDNDRRLGLFFVSAASISCMGSLIVQYFGWRGVFVLRSREERRVEEERNGRVLSTGGRRCISPGFIGIIVFPPCPLLTTSHPPRSFLVCPRFSRPAPSGQRPQVCLLASSTLPLGSLWGPALRGKLHVVETWSLSITLFWFSPKGNRGGGVREMGATENHPLLHVVWHGCLCFSFCFAFRFLRSRGCRFFVF
jgi:hypothetical protein